MVNCLPVKPNMPASKDLRIHGVTFEEGLRKMLATPAPSSGKPAKKASKRRKQKTG